MQLLKEIKDCFNGSFTRLSWSFSSNVKPVVPNEDFESLKSRSPLAETHLCSKWKSKLLL